jgi:hypothetical protein
MGGSVGALFGVLSEIQHNNVAYLVDRHSDWKADTRALVKADSILLSSWASVAPLMVCGGRSALSRALYAGAQVLFCSAMTLGS